MPSLTRWSNVPIVLIGGLLLVSALLFAALVLVAARQQDDLWAERSVRLAETAVALKSEHVEDSVANYAYWDQLLENAFYDFDRDWLRDNLGSKLEDIFGVTVQCLIDGKDHPVASYVGGGWVSGIGSCPIAWADLSLLGAQLRGLPLDGPQGASTITRIGGKPYLLSVGLVKPSNARNESAFWRWAFDNGLPLVAFATPLNETTLGEIERAYLLPDLALTERVEGPDVSFIPLLDVRRHVVAYLTWQDRKPGGAFSSMLLPLAVAIFAILLFAGAWALRQIQRTTRAIDRARAEAVAHNRTKSDFLANMSHELRTPLNAIIGFSQVIAQEVMGAVANKAYREYAQHIEDSGQHLLKLINDILDLSRIEAGKLDLHVETVDLDQLIRRLCRMVTPRATEKRLDLRFQPSAVPTLIQTDERRLGQILLNLLSNSVKFTPSGGIVSVQIMQEDRDRVAIVVSDSGIGIPQHYQEAVLRPFEQVESSLNRSHDGAGLGLPIAKTLTEQLGGRLRLKSKPEEGTTIIIDLPRNAVLPEAAEPDAERAKQDSQAA